jgi:hypothetical protein
LLNCVEVGTFGKVAVLKARNARYDTIWDDWIMTARGENTGKICAEGCGAKSAGCWRGYCRDIEA